MLRGKGKIVQGLSCSSEDTALLPASVPAEALEERRYIRWILSGSRSMFAF